MSASHKRRRLLTVTLLLCGCGNEQGVPWGPEPFEPLNFVTDFVFPNEDTIVLNTQAYSLLQVTRDTFLEVSRGAVFRSQDGGAMWARLAEESFFDLKVGASGSIWGVYFDWFSRSFPETAQIGVSRDGGESFMRLDFRDALPWGGLVERDAHDPLLLSDGRLYRMIPVGEGPAAAVEEFGSIADERIAEAVECDGVLYASTIPVEFSHGGRLLILGDSAATWEQQLGLGGADYIADFSCAKGGALWAATRDNVIFHYDPDRGAWDQIVDLEKEFHVSIISSSIVARGDELLVGATDLPAPIVRISTTGQIDEFSQLLLYRLKTDPQGRLWGAGEAGLYRWDDDAEAWELVWSTETPSPRMGVFR